MSGVNKEAPLVEESPVAVTSATNPEPDKQDSSSKPATAAPAPVDSATPLEADNEAAKSTASPKSTKIFGSFTSSTPQKAETSTKPLFGGFTPGTSSASAWTVPITITDFGATSSFTPTRDESPADKEKVYFPDFPFLLYEVVGG
jgi:hypothetical protein